jgi:ribosomal protein S18
VDYRDIIVTQVVHLEYELIGESNQHILHIDHEYIFYTEPEFYVRLNDHKQKGNFKKRHKTFKIDNSKIPFVLDGVFILYYVISKYFKNKELLKEYFSNVLKIWLYFGIRTQE